MNNQNQNNQNNNIYENYQDNENHNIFISSQMPQNDNNQNIYQQPMNMQSNTNQGNKKVLKVMMVVTLIAIIVGIGGFALVYTGVIKFNQVSPESILLSAGNIGVKKGREFQYDYQVYPETSTSKNVYYESSDPTIAEINSTTGYITTKKEGTVNITVKSVEDDQVIESSVLTVTDEKIPVTSLQLSSERIVFDLSNKSKSQLLKVNLEPYNATNQNLEFYSSDESVAIVDPTGRVFPVGFGMATITVRSKDGNATGQCEVIVTDSENKKVYFELPDKGKLVFPYAIQLDTTYLRIKYGESRKVGFTLLPPDVTEDVITWISSNPSVATVKDGLVQGVAVGQTTITARTVNDLVATLTVDVTDEEIEPTNISFDEDFYELEIGESERLIPKYDDTATVTNFTWTSSNPDVVAVDSQGSITALSSGNATIEVSTSNGSKDLATVTVLKGAGIPTSINLASSNLDLEVGTSKTIEVEGDTGNNNFIYKSADEEIATVNERGVVYGKTPGSTIIYISTVTGLTTELNVKILDVEATKISLISPEGANVKEKDTLELVAEVLPNNSTNKNIVWSTSDPKILTVDNGVVKAVSSGTATVTASIGDLKNTMDINVVSKVANVDNSNAVTNTELNDTEKDKLKSINATIEEQSATKLLISLNLDKYGYADYVDLSKTTFELVNADSTVASLKITKDKKIPADSVYVTYKSGSYGSFGIKPTVTLKNGEKLELNVTTKVLADETKVSFNIEIENTLPVYSNFPAKYQDFAKQVTNWVSENTNIATITNGFIEAVGIGSTKIKGDYHGVTFVATINVLDKTQAKITKTYEGNNFTYGSCYNLCPNGTLSDTNIKISKENCSNDKPYYIDKANTEYHYTCTVGNITEIYKGKSGTLPTYDDKLEFNYAPGTAIKKGESITLKITNWSKLSLKNAKISNTINSDVKTITNGSYKFEIPSSTTAKTITLTINSTAKNGQTYKDVLTLSVSSEPVITKISCENLTIKEGEKQNLSCTMFDRTNNQQLPITDVEYTSKNKNIAEIDANGLVSAYKKGSAKINVKSHGLSTTATVTVQTGTPVYTSLSLKLEKTNSSSKNEIQIGETATLAYTAVSGKTKTTANLDVKYTSSNPSVLSIEGNQINGLAAGQTTITASYTNTKGTELTATVDVIVVENGNLTAKIEKIICGDINIKVGNTQPLNCQMYDSINDKYIPLADAKFTVANDGKSIVSVDEAGIVTAKKVGKAKITVKAHDKSTSLTTTVLTNLPTYETIEINIEKLELAKDSTEIVSYKLKTPDGEEFINIENVKITSNKPKIVTVDGTTITAKNAGTATITASYTNPDGKAITSKKQVTVYIPKTCYRYQEEVKTYATCKNGYDFKGTVQDTCYKTVEADSKITCTYKSGIPINNRMWSNDKCFDINDWYLNSQVTKYTDTYVYTENKTKAQQFKFDEAKDIIICRDSCSETSCS